MDTKRHKKKEIIDLNLPEPHGFRIGQCQKCGKMDMLDKTDLCLNCAYEERPELALKLKEFQSKKGGEPNAS